jgi:hypothetical protein
MIILKSLKIPKGSSEVARLRKIDNTMAKRKREKRQTPSTKHYKEK